MSPGWMPSRPRPIGQVRRRVTLARHRPTRRVPVAPPAAHEAAEAALRSTSPTGAEATPPAATWTPSPAYADPIEHGELARKLPVARVVLRRSEGGHRQMTGALHRWLDRRWVWVQPRMIPLIAAFFGLIGVLNARRYLLELARGPAVVCPAPDAAQLAAPTPGHVPGHAIAHDAAGCPIVHAHTR